MPSRLSAALRELAEALEDAEADDWTVVVDSPRATSRRSPSPKSTLQASGAAHSSTASAVLQPPPLREEGQRPGGARARAAATREVGGSRPTVQEQLENVTGSSVAYRGDLRTYVILANPRQPHRLGWVQGPAGAVWPRLEATLPNGRLYGSLVRLRRVNDLEEARALWETCHPGKPMPQLLL